MSADHISLGVVGLGGWGKNVVRSFARTKHCELKYICDCNAALLEQQYRLYPQSTATDRYQSLLDDPQLEAVAIATPAPLHFAMVREALLAGKHVYVEKPMTLRSAEAGQLVELAGAQHRKLMVGHLLEYHPAVTQIKQYVDGGELGDIYYMYCQRLNLGVVRQHENAFWSLAPHDISVILYLFGMEPEEISASGQCFLQPGVEDVVFVNLRFPDGKIAQIHVSWLDPHKERKMVLVGAKKMLVFDDVHPTEKVRIFDKGACFEADVPAAGGNVSVRHGDIYVPYLPPAEPLLIETQHFIDAVRSDAQPRSDGYDGLRVVKILEQVEQQLRAAPQPGEAEQTPRLRVFAA